MQKILLRSKPYFKKPSNWGLASAFVSGKVTDIPKENKLQFKELNLNHLFSPSGLHFTSLLFPLSPLFKLLPNTQWVIYLLLTSLFFLPGLFSLKRSLLYLNLSSINRKFINYPGVVIFITVFVIDFMVGAFAGSLLSLIFSLLFWGIFVMEKKFIRRLVYLALAQYMCICFFPGIYYPMAISFNMALSILFTLIFPIILINFILPSHSIFFTLGEELLDKFQLLVTKSHGFVSLTPSVAPSHLVLWFLIFFIFFRSRRVLLVVVMAITVSMPTDNKTDLRGKFELKLLKASSWKR